MCIQSFDVIPYIIMYVVATFIKDLLKPSLKVYKQIQTKYICLYNINWSMIIIINIYIALFFEITQSQNYKRCKRVTD